MRVTLWVAAVMLASCAIPRAAGAAEPFYFHKMGVSAETFAADFAECDSLADGVRVARPYVYASNIYASAAGAFLGGLFSSGERRRMVDNVLRTCMADKGYRRIVASKDVARDLKKLDSKARIDRLLVLSSAPQSNQKVLPR